MTAEIYCIIFNSQMIQTQLLTEPRQTNRLSSLNKTWPAAQKQHKLSSRLILDESSCWTCTFNTERCCILTTAKISAVNRNLIISLTCAEGGRSRFNQAACDHDNLDQHTEHSSTWQVTSVFPGVCEAAQRLQCQRVLISAAGSRLH